MKRSKAFNAQTGRLFGHKTRGRPIPQLIQQYKSAIAQTHSSILTGSPSLIWPEFYLYGDLLRANDYHKQYGYNIPFFEACVRNPNRHQWCMGQFVATQAAMAIDTLNLPGGYSTFDDLYEAIAQKVNIIHGINRSTIYDAALRIGHVMGLSPDDYVYIHDGLRSCAAKIIGKNIPGKDYKIRRQYFDNAYPGFKSMPSMEIEDFICIYKDVI